MSIPSETQNGAKDTVLLIILFHFWKTNIFPWIPWVTSGIWRVFLSLETIFFFNKMNSLLCNFNTTIAITCQYNLCISAETWVSVHACTHTTTIHITLDKFKTILTVILFLLSLNSYTSFVYFFGSVSLWQNRYTGSVSVCAVEVS